MWGIASRSRQAASDHPVPALCPFGCRHFPASDAIAGMGHEIGGHSVTHPDLTTLPSDEAKRQICDDRVNLTNWGFRVTSLAYPPVRLQQRARAR